MRAALGSVVLHVAEDASRMVVPMLEGHDVQGCARPSCSIDSVSRCCCRRVQADQHACRPWGDVAGRLLQVPPLRQERNLERAVDYSLASSQ